MMINWLRSLFPYRLNGMRRSHKSRKRTSQWIRNKATCIEMLETRKLLTMLAPTSVAAGTTPTDVQIADINGDGKPDVVSLNSSMNSVGVQLGNGDGTFHATVNASSGGASLGMNVADYNHDGRLDIATNNGFSIDILFGNGDGTFQLPALYAVGAYARDMKSADFNHDGFCDIVTASAGYGGTSQLLLNSGLGTFPTTKNIAITAFGLQVEVGDLNNDGNPDLIETGNFSTGIFLSQGDGTFRSAGSISTASSAPVLADFNKDGKLDLAVISGGRLNVYAGDGAGGLAAPISYPVTGGNRIVVADMDGNGTADIVSNFGQVAFGRGDGTYYTPIAYTTPGIKMAAGDLNGDGAVDIVSTTGVALSGVTVSLNAHNDAAALAGAVALRVTAPNGVVAGVPFAVTVNAIDAMGNVVPGFIGTVGVSGDPGTVPVTYTFTPVDNGVHTIANAAAIFRAGLGTYTVSSPFLPDATGHIAVMGAPASKFSVVAQVTSVAGNVSSLTVSALDLYGNATSGYIGSVHITSSDVQAGLPANYTFTTTDAGVHSFNVILKTAGGQTVSANDVTSTIAGTSGFVTVTPAAAVSLSVTGGGGFIGSVNAVHISALDTYGNTATSDNGVVHLATSDSRSVTSANAALVNGIGIFTVTPKTLGSQTLKATDASNGLIAGSEVINVTPGWGVRFVATHLASTVAGQTHNTTLTIYDSFGNVSTVFTGWVAVASTDPRTSISYVYMSAADAGIKTIPVTFSTAGSQAITISDYANSLVTVTQAGIIVTPAAPASIFVTPLIGTVAGVAQNYTVTVHDAYGNVATNYQGTLNATSSDALATIPSHFTFTAANVGTHTFSMTFKSSGGQSITIVDAANPVMLTYFQRDIIVTPAALSTFAFKGASLSNSTAGAVFNLTVSAVDPFGNPITRYTGTILFTCTDAQMTLPANYVFTVADAGTHTFSTTLKTAGTQSITVSDSANSSIVGTLAAIVVKAAATSNLAISAPANAGIGVGQSVTVTLKDAYGNVSTGYSGTVKISSSDIQAILPTNYTFTNKDAGVHTFSVTLNTAGSQSVTAVDTVNASLKATQNGISVTQPVSAVASFSVTGFPATVAGSAKSFTVTARDTLGNVVSGYVGIVAFSSSDAQAGLPANYTFTAADAGAHTFSATLKTAGTQTITVTDTAATTVIGTETGIAVAAGTATSFVISAPTSVTSGVGFKFTMTVLDAYGNVATGYASKVHLSSSDLKSGTSDYTFSNSDKGIHVFSYTFSTLGSQTLTVTDITNNSITVKYMTSVLAK